MLEHEKAWLACAVDGEGYITLEDRVDPRTGWRIRKIGVGVCNTDLRLIRNAARLLGNEHLYKQAPRSHIGDTGHAGKKTVYQARQVDRDKAVQILKLIRPYLLIKGEKADEAIAFVERTDWTRRQSPELRARKSRAMRARWADGSFTGTRGRKLARERSS